MARFLSFMLLCTSLALVLSTGCIKPQGAPDKAAGGPPKAPEVIVDLPTHGEITDYEDFTGRTMATQTVDVRARVTGYLDKINFKDREGQEIEAGEVLAEIDPRPYLAEVARAQSSVAQADSRLARLELDYQRARKTVASKTISQEQFDQVTGDRNEAKAAIEVAKANLNLAKLNLSYCKVKAPITGRVGRTQFDPGNLVRADETILTTLVAMHPMYVYFEVDERTMLRLRRYMEEGRIRTQGDKAVAVKIGLADEEGFPHSGSVNFVDNRLDPATGTLQIRGIFDNSERLLLPSLFVRVRLPIGEPYQALLISEQALGTDQEQKFVYVIDENNKAQYRRVKVGKLQKGRRVILEGLNENERVVVSGLQRVRPELQVQPRVLQAANEGGTAGRSDVAEAPGPVAKEKAHN